MWLLSNKVTVRDSGLLEGFCDCHNHLLPGVDDGVEKTEETLSILEQWEELGVNEVWLTPHIMEDIPNMPDDLKVGFQALQSHYQGTIKLHLAAEHMIDNLFLSRLNDRNLLPIGMTGGHLLVETSYFSPPINMEMVIDLVKDRGYIPILAHPERYQYMDRKDYRRWKERGVLFQLNVPSLVEAYGPEVTQKAEWLLKEDMYDYCGTDTHSIEQTNHFLNSDISRKTVRKVRQIAKEQELPQFGIKKSLQNQYEE